MSDPIVKTITDKLYPEDDATPSVRVALNAVNDAVADLGRAIEDTHWQERHDAVRDFLAGLSAQQQLNLLIGMGVVAHDRRLMLETLEPAWVPKSRLDSAEDRLRAIHRMWYVEINAGRQFLCNSNLVPAMRDMLDGYEHPDTYMGDDDDTA